MVRGWWWWLLFVPAHWAEQDEPSAPSYHQVPLTHPQLPEIAQPAPEFASHVTTHSATPSTGNLNSVASGSQYTSVGLSTTMFPLDQRAPALNYCNMFQKISEAPILYHCKICGKSVSNRWHHTSIHKPQHNKCPMCHQTFTRKDNMKAHIKMKHGAAYSEFSDRDFSKEKEESQWVF